jgi:hypothetical protein
MEKIVRLKRTGRKFQTSEVVSGHKRGLLCLTCGIFANGLNCDKCKELKKCKLCGIVCKVDDTNITYSYQQDQKDKDISHEYFREVRTICKNLNEHGLCESCIGWRDMIQNYCHICEISFENDFKHFKECGNTCTDCNNQINFNVKRRKSYPQVELDFLERRVYTKYMSKYKYTDEGKAHLHTLDDKPLIGTSSAASVLAKPLTWWASGLACEKFGWMNKGNAKKGWTPKEQRLEKASKRFKEIREYDDEQYLDLLDEAYKAHSEKLDSSAVEGTDLHGIIEDYIKECIKEGHIVSTGDKRIQPFIDWALIKVRRFLWSEMHCYSERLWVGGITDFGFEDIEGKYSVGDIKSSKEAYLSQFWQCAGYDIQISENGGYNKDGEKVFELDKPIDYYTIFPFGMDKPEAQYNYDVEGGKAAFEAEIFLYKKLNA